MSTRGRDLRLATRGSDLALRQAGQVRAALADRRFDVELVEVETTGDRVRDELIHRLGKTGAFVRSLDERVLAGDVDAAVHSMKDVPTESPADLVVAAVPERGRPEDLLVTPDGSSLADLPEGATVGTSSLRRRAQLLAERPDLTVEPLRGNVDTRIEKLLAPSLQREHERRLEAEEGGSEGEEDTTGGNEGTSSGGNGGDSNGTDHQGDDENEADGRDDDEESTFERSVEAWFDDLSEIERRALGREVETEYDAVVLAAAGLERAGLLHHVDAEPLETGTFVPAPGQGALVVTAADGPLAESLRDVLDHPRSRVETTVERTVLAELGGGCVAPLGVHAVLQGAVVSTRVRVLSRDGTEEVSATRDLPVERHPEAAREFAADLADRGAADLIARAKREAGAADDDASSVGEE
ncbi:MAG: hydroxymethylbilane synthase [Haloarculaceae archaeon]